MQISGFTDDDIYADVVRKGSKGLEIQAIPSRLHLIVSGGMVMDTPLLGGKAWTLGRYIQEFGGTSARGKKQFGIYIPIDVEEEEMEVNVYVQTSLHFGLSLCPYLLFYTHNKYTDVSSSKPAQMPSGSKRSLTDFPLLVSSVFGKIINVYLNIEAVLLFAVLIQHKYLITEIDLVATLVYLMMYHSYQ